MDLENAQELRRGGGDGSALRRPSSAKRQLRALSGHIINSNHSNSNGKAPSYSLSAWDNGEVGGEVTEMWRTERPKGSRWSSSNKEDEGEMGGGGSSSSNGGGSKGEEACLARAAAANTISPKKPRINGKVSEDCNAVDPAVVPRKLRSAINKRRSQSASPPSSVLKKHHISRGLKVVSDKHGKRSTKSTLDDLITEEEEEVAEALSSLASMVVIANPNPAKITDDSRTTEEVSEAKAISDTKLTSHTSLDAVACQSPKEEGAKLCSPCTGYEAINLSLGKPLNKIVKTEDSALEQSVVEAGSQKLNPAPSGNFQPDFKGCPLLSQNEKMENSALGEPLTPSNPWGVSSQFSSRNGLLQPTQVNASPVQKPNFGLWPHELQSTKLKPLSTASHMANEEVAPTFRQGLSNGGHRHMTAMPSNRAVEWPGSSASGTGLTLMGSDCLSGKAHPLTTERPWKRCTIHVFIGRLIQNHQNVEKKHQLSLATSQLKGKEVANSGVQATDDVVGRIHGTNNVISSGSNGFIIERNNHDARIQMLQDGKLLQAQQASCLSGVYAQQKQACDFLPLSANSETGNSMKSSGEPPVAYQMQHHTLMPFPFPHVSYANSYPGQLAAGANQQLQLHHFMGNPFYGPHMVHPGGAVKHQHQQHQHQQQIWQAHQSQYRLPLAVPKWQNGRPHGPFPSILPRGQPSPVASHPPPAAVMFGANGAYPVPHAQQHHQFMHAPSSSSSSREKKKRQQQDGGSGSGFSTDGPPQLQLLCNGEHT